MFGCSPWDACPGLVHDCFHRVFVCHDQSAARRSGAYRPHIHQFLGILGGFKAPKKVGDELGTCILGRYFDRDVGNPQYP